MKIHKLMVNKILIESYNDSHIDWVVVSLLFGTMRFKQVKFTMKESINFYCELHNIRNLNNG